MAKAKTQFVCAECGGASLKWQGQCPHCNAWNSLSEARVEAAGDHRYSALVSNAPTQSLGDVQAREMPRIASGIDEFDRVLGGGFVEGGVVLIGGDPGIGKSTLLLQSLAALSLNAAVLYVSGEESAAQVALRARRLGVDADTGATAVGDFARAHCRRRSVTEKPSVLVIDSIQTLYTEQLQSAPGSVAQVRECAAQLTRLAKQSGLTLIMIGHVTKDGSLAGPRVLEHMVDTVLYFEGESHSSFRLIRAFKNRFGAVNELGVFAMTDRGLKGVSQSVGAVSVEARRAGCRLVRDGDAGGHAAVAGRDPGAGRCRARAESAQTVGRARSAATGDAACGLASPCGHRGVRSGRFRQRGRRCAHRRARRRSGGAARGRLVDARQAVAARAGRIRRNRPGRRSAAGAARPGASARGSEAWLFDGADTEGRTRRSRRSKGSR